MREARVSVFWARVWTGVIVGVIACTFFALIAGLVGLVYGLVTWNAGVVWPTLRLVGLIYVVFIPITVVRSVRRGRVSGGGYDAQAPVEDRRTPRDSGTSA